MRRINPWYHSNCGKAATLFALMQQLHPAFHRQLPRRNSNTDALRLYTNRRSLERVGRYLLKTRSQSLTITDILYTLL